MELIPFKRESVFPLPVTFISTISKTGVRNIAPYSCVMPVLRPLDLVCIATAKRRDTLDNIRDTKEFVINMATTRLSDALIPTARLAPPEVDEFVSAGLDEKPSVIVKPPGIKGCYAWLECRLDKLIEEESYILIIGKVVHLEITDEIYRQDGSWDVEKAEPLVMTGSDTHMHYCTVTATGRNDPFSAMFPNHIDPVAKKHMEK